jgi:tetratricopeptide (TPR) repeat protein
MQAGIAHHQAGRLREAESHYREVLARNPSHPEALHMLGVLAHQGGRDDIAVELIGQAIRLGPDDATCHSNLGNVLSAMGRDDEAIRSYQRALALRPDHADDHYNLGNVLSTKGRFDEAEASFRRALALRPDHADANLNLGIVMQATGRLEEAMRCYRLVLDLRPDCVEAYNNIGIILAGQLQHDAAIEVVKRALDLRPDYAPAWQNIGTQYEAKGLVDKALECYRKAISLKPDFAIAWNNVGNALCTLGDFAGSQAAYEKSLSLNPRLAEPCSNLGNLMQVLGRLDESLVYADRALALSPNSPDFLWNKAFTLLLKGDYEAGWRLAEERWKFHDPRRVRRRLASPLWLGEESVAGRRILLHHEQGLGDTLQMLRYARPLAERGAHVLVLVPAALASVAATVPGVAEVVVEGAALPAVDLQCPFMSLPLAFHTTLASVPAQIPYLFAPEPERAAWRERLGARRRPRIGLVWSGSVTHSNDRNRSIPLATLLQALQADADYVSVQKEYRPQDQSLLDGPVLIRDFSGELTDFGATAGLLAELDLVITVDTSVAHLAGGMGRPTWLLLPYAPDYRWMLGREDSPWYPTMRLLRQPRFSDWASVMDRLQELLMTRTASFPLPDG